MSKPLSYDQHIAACRKWGIDVKLWPGSRNLCRCHLGSHDAGGPTIREFADINGVMNHITAGFFGSLTGYISWLVNDRALPLKAQYTIAQDGTVWLLSAGRCNHAGKISTAALNASKGDAWSLNGYQDLRGHAVDGNAHFYGVEVIATSRMNSAQYQSLVALNAALSDAHGWTGQGSCGHGEASDQRGYSDPNLDMGEFRRDVMAKIAAGAPGGGSSSGAVKSVTSSVASAAVSTVKKVLPKPKASPSGTVLDAGVMLSGRDGAAKSQRVALGIMLWTWTRANPVVPDMPGEASDGTYNAQIRAAVAELQKRMPQLGQRLDGYVDDVTVQWLAQRYSGGRWSGVAK